MMRNKQKTRIDDMIDKDYLKKKKYIYFEIVAAKFLVNLAKSVKDGDSLITIVKRGMWSACVYVRVRKGLVVTETWALLGINAILFMSGEIRRKN